MHTGGNADPPQNAGTLPAFCFATFCFATLPGDWSLFDSLQQNRD
jgi:hypothetical protein